MKLLLRYPIPEAGCCIILSGICYAITMVSSAAAIGFVIVAAFGMMAVSHRLRGTPARTETWKREKVTLLLAAVTASVSIIIFVLVSP